MTPPTRLRHKIILVLCAVLFLVLVFAPLVGASATNASECGAGVTNREWASFDVGDKRTDVRELLGGPGVKQGHNVRWYPICDKDPQTHRAIVWYDHGRLRGGTWVIIKNGVFPRSGWFHTSA